MTHKQTPRDFLKLIIGRPVVVKLNSGSDYRGVLIALDGYMNVVLEQTEEYFEGQLKNKYGDAFIRGNNGWNSEMRFYPKYKLDDVGLCTKYESVLDETERTMAIMNIRYFSLPMKKKRNVAGEIVSRASSVLPAFTDIFDEESFYIFFACLVVLSFVLAFMLGKYFGFTVKDAGESELRARKKRSK